MRVDSIGETRDDRLACPHLISRLSSGRVASDIRDLEDEPVLAQAHRRHPLHFSTLPSTSICHPIHSATGLKTLKGRIGEMNEERLTPCSGELAMILASAGMHCAFC